MKITKVVLFALFLSAGFTGAQSKLGISIQGAYSLPIGSFGDSYKAGYGGLGTVTYSVGKNLDITATAGYLTYDNKIIEGATSSTLLILGGVRYYLTGNTFRPYLTAQAGIYSCKTKIDAVLPGMILSSGTTTDLGFAGGAGFLYKLGEKLDLDINAVINGSGNNFVNLSAGVHFAI